MSLGRQYFGLAADHDDGWVYVLGGYSTGKGILSDCERFSIKGHNWMPIEHLNVPRINMGSCLVSKKYLYVFGGSDENGILDSIERYNSSLDVWTLLQVKMQSKVTNLFAHAINEDAIIVLGGVKRKTLTFVNPNREAKKEYETESKVHIFKPSKLKWKELKAFPFRKKISNILYNDNGKLFCFIIESNRELPQLFVYDIRTSFPQFDKYWNSEEQQKTKSKRIKGKDVAGKTQSEKEKNMYLSNGETPYKALVTEQKKDDKGKIIEMKEGH